MNKLMVSNGLEIARLGMHSKTCSARSLGLAAGFNRVPRRSAVVTSAKVKQLVLLASQPTFVGRA